MPILKDIPIALTPEQVVSAQRQGRIHNSLLRDAQQAIDLGQTLWQPMAVYDWFDVGSVKGEHVTLVDHNRAGKETGLHVGPKADLLAPAEQVIVGLVTIGPALEEEVRHLHDAREGLMAYMLDSVGVMALGAVGEAIRCLVEEAAGGRGWGVSPSLSPGSLVGWPLQGQREVCSLLPLDSIGVRLNDHCVLQPHKSASTVIGLGPGYDSTRVGSVCRFCALAETCWRRREDLS